MDQIKRFDPAAEFAIAEGCFINELSNTPDDPAVSIARTRVPRGVTTRWHRLKDTVERYVILEVVLIPPSIQQRIASIGDGI